MQASRLLGDVAATKYLHSSLRTGNVAPAISGDFKVSLPDPLAPFHLASPGERKRRVRDVLSWAWRIYRRGNIGMCDAINEASETSPAGEYAKAELRRILLEINLQAWESHPNRTRSDINALFRKAIGKLTPHRGGWRVRR